MTAPLQSFRIHFADGSKCDVQAKDANAARKQAERPGGALIIKIKRIKEAAHAR